MQVTEFPTLADHVRMLPAEGAGRHRQLNRIIDLHAAAEAAAALQTAAARSVHDAGVVRSVLTSAAAVLGGEVDDAAVHDRLREAVVSPEFLSLLPSWITELREIASLRPDTGACTLASALELWQWTTNHLRSGAVTGGESLAPAFDELAETLCPLLAARSLALEIASRPEADRLRTDLCHVHSAHAAAIAGARCAELVFGYRRHLVWDAEGCATCFAGEELDDLEAIIPGIASGARMAADVVESDGSHPAKAGPCAHFAGVEAFTRLRQKLDGCLTGARLARDGAAAAITSSIAVTTQSAGRA